MPFICSEISYLFWKIDKNTIIAFAACLLLTKNCSNLFKCF